MEINEKAVKELIARGDTASILRVFDSLQREVVVKDELVLKYVIDNGNLRKAFNDQENELDRIRRVFQALREVCAAAGLTSEYQEAELRIHGVAAPHAENG
ncbi:MAG TPA: hypothetical protein VMV68_01940 [Spirochaetia bacterium]|nr:hypothetical protein [Spirochaetia bacterium]